MRASSSKWIQIALIIMLIVIGAFAVGYGVSVIAHRPATVLKTITKTVSIQTNATDEYRKAASTLLQEVIPWVEEDRGLKFDENVRLVVLTREWVIEHWGRGYLNLTQVRVEEAVLKALFLVPQDYNLTRTKLSQSGYTVAASADKTIYVVREYFDPSKKIEAGKIFAHELTHILQGIHFKIPKGRSWDEAQAIRAVVEGDADLVASDYLLQHGGQLTNTDEEAFDPVTALWLFPYLHGEKFMRYIRETGGWEMVNKVYARMPSSTAEILHPDKYLHGWRPREIRFNESLNSSWTLQLRDRLGEYFIRQMLRAHLGAKAAGKAADGWAGDLFEYYVRDGEYMFRWKITWEDRRELEEFLDSFRLLLMEVGGQKIGAETWVTPFEVVKVIEADEQTILIEGSSIHSSLK